MTQTEQVTFIDDTMAVAQEMLQGDQATGAQVTRAQAWQNACKEIVKLRRELKDAQEWHDDHCATSCNPPWQEKT